MSKFSDKNLDRSYSQKELNQLSENDLTKLAFRRNLKNLGFFGVGAIVIPYLVSGFGAALVL